MKKCNVIGIDLAKNIIQVCIINKHVEVRSNKAMSPLKLKEFLTKSSPSIVAFEGASTCHHWGGLQPIYLMLRFWGHPRLA
jgi:transposase